MDKETYLLQFQVQVQGDPALRALNKQLQATAKNSKTASNAFRNVSKGTKNYGNIASNVGFQIQDMAVQIQGGTSVMRSMSQQLPQMLVGFGAWGAALGVVTALLPTLTTLVAGSNSEIESMSDVLDKAAASMDKMASTTQAADFSGWINSFNQLDQVGRNIAKTLLDVRIQLQEIAFNEAFERFTSFATNMLPAGRMMEAQLTSMANKMGLTIGQVEELQQLVNENGGTLLGDPEAMSRMVEILGESAGYGQEQLKNLEKLIQLRKDLDAANTASSAAGAAGATGVAAGGTPGRGPASPETTNQIEATASAYALARIEANDYAQTIYEAEEGQRQFNESLVQASTTLQEEATFLQQTGAVFEDTFSRAFDGVAMGTQTVSEAFTNMSKVIIAELLKIAAYRTIAGFTASGTFGGQVAFAQGGVVSGGNVVPFAKGGVVNQPTVFPMANGGVGLMGEAGAPEAVMPLKRMGNGNLGVESSGMNVTVNNMAQGVSVNPRQGSDGLTIDVVLAQAARAVQSGGNVFADSIEKTYSVNRGRGVY